MKKVISFVLVLALVLGSFSMAFAAPATTGLSDVEGDANETAIKVVNDLGIVTGYTDGTFQPAKAVTRAEFAAMITRALDIPESALAGYTSTTFKDTTGYGWAVPYLAFCNDKGIMLGDGNGNAMPGKTINVNEAMTMILRAMGLTNNSALLVGTWPSNYVTIAKTLGLYDDVAATNLVDRASAAQIIYNALTEAGFVVNADGDTTAAPALITNLAAHYDDAIVEYNADSLIPLAEYIGAYANIYYNSDWEIVAIDPISTFLTGTYNADGTFTVDDVDYKGVTTGAFSTTPAALDITNGDGAATATVFTADTDYTIAVDYVGKTVKTIYSVVDWTVTTHDYAADDVQDEIADDQKLLGEKFELDNSSEIDDASFQLLGVASLDKIAEDDVVYVYTHPTRHTIVKIEVGNATVTGTVTKVNSDGDEFTINGKTYAASDEISADPAVGEKGTAYLNYAGDIYEWDVTDATADNYAVVTGTRAAISRDATIVLLDKAGLEKEYVLTSDADDTTTAALAEGTIVTFSLDKNGKVDEINAAGTTTVAGTVASDYKVIDTKAVADGVVVFLLDSDGEYSVGALTDLAESVTVSAVIDSNSKIVALLAGPDSTGSEDSTYGVVNAYGDTLYDEDADEEYTLADIILDGKTMTEVKTDGLTTPETTSVGALAKITIDSDGVITKVEAATADADVTSILGTVTVSAINGRVIKTSAGNSYKIADDAVVYVWDDEDEVWAVKSLAAVKKCYVKLYDTDDDTSNGYEVVMANETATL